MARLRAPGRGWSLAYGCVDFISLFVVGMALRYRAMAAVAKGATMGAFGLWILGLSAWHALNGTVPHAVAMGAVA